MIRLFDVSCYVRVLSHREAQCLAVQTQDGIGFFGHFARGEAGEAVLPASPKLRRLWAEAKGSAAEAAAQPHDEARREDAWASLRAWERQLQAEALQASQDARVYGAPRPARLEHLAGVV